MTFNEAKTFLLILNQPVRHFTWNKADEVSRDVYLYVEPGIGVMMQDMLGRGIPADLSKYTPETYGSQKYSEGWELYEPERSNDSSDAGTKG